MAPSPSPVSGDGGRGCGGSNARAAALGYHCAAVLKTVNRLLTILILAMAVAGGGCIFKIHRVEVQQGNILSAEMLAQVKPGMSRREVQSLLGTPLVTDVFHAERWDYYYLRRDNTRKGAVQNRVTVVFDDDGVARVEGNPEIFEEIP